MLLFLAPLLTLPVSSFHLKTINQRLENFWAGYDKGNPVVDIPALFAAYQSLRSDAISQNLISVSNERLLDMPNRPHVIGLNEDDFCAGCRSAATAQITTGVISSWKWPTR